MAEAADAGNDFDLVDIRQIPDDELQDLLGGTMAHPLLKAV
jgi:hypothetical protein